MDDKLLSKICFNLVSQAGFIRLMMPKAYELLFNLEEEFDKDELETILDLAEKSDAVMDTMELVDELLKGKEENDG